MKLDEIKQLDAQYYMNVFGERFPVAFVDGHGCVLVDMEGKEYVDFLGGIAVNCLGYSDEGLIETICEQAKCLIHASNYFYVPSQARAAKLLCQATGYDKAFFSNSGAEAMEGAMKLARKYFYNRGENRYEFITMQGSFHGRTLATLAATGQSRFHEPYAPLPPSFAYVPYNDAAAIEAAISERTCGVILEPIQGEGGVLPAGDGFLKSVRQICDKYGIIMIVDEIQTGMGRTGSLLCSAGHGVRGDIVTLAKALGGGVPVGAFLATDAVASAFQPGDHGSTFGGNHLATAAAEYILTQLTTTDLLAHVREMGAYLSAALGGLVQRHACALEVRGQGLMQALRIEAGRPVKEIVCALLQQGYCAGSAGGNCLRFLPPYIIQKADIDSLTAALDAIL